MAAAYKNDVWHSSNGKDWTQATASAPWEARIGHAVVAFGGKMWLLGGGAYGVTSFEDHNDVWCSTNGSDWTKVTGSAAWAKRDGHTVVVYDNKMWLIGGGVGYTDTRYNDVWYSTDGENWNQATASAQWSKRYGHSSAVFDSKIWVIAGDGGSKLNDVWWYKGATEVSDNINTASSNMLKLTVTSSRLASVSIRYVLSKFEMTRVNVYNGAGDKIAALCNGNQPAGTYKIIWNGIGYSGTLVPAGIYFIRLEAGNKYQVEKVVFMK